MAGGTSLASGKQAENTPLLHQQQLQQQHLRPKKADDDELSESGSLTGSGYYKTIHPSGPQLCHSPMGYRALHIASAAIQTPDEELQSGEYRPLIQETKVYKRRWYVLLVYCSLAASQGGLWNVYGPIAATVEDAFGWTDATIALLSNWGPIAYLLGGVVISWMMDVKGLRMACIVSAILVAIGSGLRCITFNTPLVTWFAHLAQFFNGLAGPAAMAAPPILSALWFPPRERTTATAIGTVLNSMGVALSFIMGPLLVPDVPSNSTNVTDSTSFYNRQYLSFSSSENFTPFHITAGSNNTHEFSAAINETAADRVSREKKGIALYMYIGGGWSAVMLLLLLAYFPSRPPLPPSPSAALQREPFLKGLKHLLTRGQFWLVAFIYGVSTGTLGGWSSVLDVILKPHNIGEDEAGWIGFYSTCSSCVGALIVARFADFFSRILKWLILCLYIVGTIAFAIFALLTANIIQPTTALLYVTIIVGNTALSAAIPLIFELACELSYPTGEGITNGILTTSNNLFGLVFLFVMMAPDIGTLWTNWMVAGTAGVCLPLLFLLKEHYNRLEIDDHNPSLAAEITVTAPAHHVSGDAKGAAGE